MSYLPIILVVLYLLNKKGGISELLGGLDVESISPLLSLFGVNKGMVELLSSQELKNVLSGNADIKSIIPLITTLMTSIKASEPSNQEHTTTTESTFTPEYLNPIKDVASPDVYTVLNNYFDN